MMPAELLLPFRAELGEGINLFPDGLLRWVDLPRGEIHILDGAEDRLWLVLPCEVSKVLPWREGLIALGQTAIHFLDQFGAERDRITLHDSASNLRCSDGMVLPSGEIILGILDRDLTPGRSRLIKVDHNHAITEIVSGADISNGIALLADGKRIVWSDSPRRTLETFDLDLLDRSLTGRRVHGVLPEGHGLIDGLVADSDGGVWTALWAGGGVAHFDDSGALLEVVTLDAPNVTACAFDSKDDLIITTGTATLDESTLARLPGAGGIWRVKREHHGTTGLPIHVATI